jgi:hypothetical protein
VEFQWCPFDCSDFDLTAAYTRLPRLPRLPNHFLHMPELLHEYTINKCDALSLGL